MTLSVIQAIHQRWAAAGELSALLPPSRVTTGASETPQTPYAVITKEADQPLAACNDGSAVGSVDVRIQIFHTNYDAASAIVEQLGAAFNRKDFDLGGGDRVINMWRTNSSEQQNDGVWRIVVDFTCAVHRAPRT